MKPGVYEQVMERDKGCVLHLLEPGHVCYTRFGMEHPWDDLDRVTYEHVKLEPRMGKRAPDDPSCGVALCGFVNNRPPTKVQRGLFRAYLQVWDMFRTLFRPEEWHAYLTTPAPIFEGRSALFLIRAGRTDDVLASLDQLASGAFV